LQAHKKTVGSAGGDALSFSTDGGDSDPSRLVTNISHCNHLPITDWRSFKISDLIREKSGIFFAFLGFLPLDKMLYITVVRWSREL